MKRIVRVLEGLEEAPDNIDRVLLDQGLFSGPDKWNTRPIEGFFENLSLGVYSEEYGHISETQIFTLFIGRNPAAIKREIGGAANEPFNLFYNHLRLFGLCLTRGKVNGFSSSCHPFKGDLFFQKGGGRIKDDLRRPVVFGKLDLSCP